MEERKVNDSRCVLALEHHELEAVFKLAAPPSYRTNNGTVPQMRHFHARLERSN